MRLCIKFLVCMLLVLLSAINGYTAQYYSEVYFPVDGLLGDSLFPRDDGTALITSGERKNYTTLWWGKYGWGNDSYTNDSWQYRYKGSGGHPGMDIIGSVGENIYAFADGVVKYAKDKGDGWGGHIVIKHDKYIFNTDTPIWSIYAHLRKWYVKDGDNIKAGQLIGLMGGDKNDLHHGDSEARHLHFQIDTEDVFAYPYFSYPTEIVNNEVPKNTIDPIAFIESHGHYFVGKTEQGWFFEDGYGPMSATIEPREPLPLNLNGFWSEPFADCHRYNGGYKKLGRPTHYVYGIINSDNEKLYIQPLEDPNGVKILLVLNNFVKNTNYDDRLGVVYILKYAFVSYWLKNYDALGPPVTNMYITEDIQGNKVLVQWFEKSEENYKVVVFDVYDHYNGEFVGYGSSTEMGIEFDAEQFAQDKMLSINGGQGGGSVYEIPQNLTATLTTETQAELTWEINTVDSFYFDILQNGVSIGTTTDEEYTVTGLNPSTEYCYQVVACVSNTDKSAPSNTACVTTNDENGEPPAETIPLDTPENITATVISSSQINLSWTSGDNPENTTDNNANTIYVVYRDGVLVEYTELLTFEDKNLSPNTTYTYTMKATNVANEWTDFTGSVTATTLYAAPENAVGSTTRVNTTSENTQSMVRVASLIDGKSVYTWQSYAQDGDAWGVCSQMYNADGSKFGTEQIANTTTVGSQWAQSVTKLKDGGFVIFWHSEQDASGYGIIGQVFDANGQKVGSEMIINETILGDQMYPDACTLLNGDILVTWESADADGFGIYVQKFSSTFERIGHEYLVNSTTDGEQILPNICELSYGGAVVMWQSNDDGSDWGVYAQIIDSNYQKIGAEFQVNTFTMNDQKNIDVAGLPNGGFVAVWESTGIELAYWETPDGREGQDGSLNGCFGQIFDGSGIKQGQEFLINTTTDDHQSYPNVASNGNGGFIVVWESYSYAQPEDTTKQIDVYAQAFDMFGNTVGGEILVNTNTTGNQRLPDTAFLSDQDTSIVSYTSDQDNGTDGIYTQSYLYDILEVGSIGAGPEGLKIDCAIPGLVRLNWKNVFGTTRYMVYRNGVGIGSTTSVYFIDLTAEAGVEYTYMVVAEMGQAWTDPSDALKITIPDIQPGKSTYKPHKIVEDLNANGSVDIVASKIDETSEIPVVIAIDSSNATVINQVPYFGANCIVKDVINYGNLDGANGPEIGLVVFDYTEFKLKQQIRDILTGELYFGSGSILPAPTSIDLTSITSTEAGICWQAVEGAYLYRVKRNGVQVAELTDTCFSDSNLTPDKMYTYTIEAVRNNLVSEESVEFVILTMSKADCPPNNHNEHVYYTDTTGLKMAFLGNCPFINQPVLYILDAVTSEMVEEIPYFSSGYTGVAMSKQIVDGQLLIAVLAENQNGGESEIEIREIPSGILYSNTGEGTYLPGPEDLTLTDVGLNSANLTWLAVPGADKYLVYRDGVLIAELTTTSFADTGLEYATTYRYTIEAVVNHVTSDQSQELLITTVSPVACLPSTYSYHDYFYDSDPKIAALGVCPTTNEPYLYIIDVLTGQIVADYQTHSEDYTATSFNKFMINGQIYFGIMAQSQIDGTMTFKLINALTGELYTADALPEPDGLFTSEVSEYAVGLNWGAVPGASTYLVYRDGVQIAEVTDTSYTDGSVEPSNIYTYTVIAVSATQVSGFSAEFIVATPSEEIEYCLPTEISKHVGFSDNGTLKIAYLAICSTTDTPMVYIKDVSTGELEHFVSFHETGDTPTDLFMQMIGEDWVITVNVIKSTGDTFDESRFMATGIIYFSE